MCNATHTRMKLHELISVNAPLLKVLHKNGIKADAYKYVEIYDKYLEMTENGDKITYIVANLATSFDICERTIYRIIELFSQNVIM